jgi:hypothetical protein
MGKMLYIGNLAYAVTNKALEALFSKAGIYESASVVVDRDTGQSPDLVEMSSHPEAQGDPAIQRTRIERPCHQSERTAPELGGAAHATQGLLCSLSPVGALDRRPRGVSQRYLQSPETLRSASLGRGLLVAPLRQHRDAGFAPQFCGVKRGTAHHGIRSVACRTRVILTRTPP